MKNILIISGSSHRESINLALARHAGALIPDAELNVLDLNDFEMPIYSQDLEEESGIPDKAKSFVSEIESSDGIILSLAEHNGSYTAAFKNIMDWATRHKQKLWSEKPMLLMATSPGGRGGATVLAAAGQTFPHLGAKIASSFSLPSFYEQFSANDGVTDAELSSKLADAVQNFARH